MVPEVAIGTQILAACPPPPQQPTTRETLELSSTGHCGTCGRHTIREEHAKTGDNLTIKPCRLCSRDVCSICRVLTDCPKCYFDLRDYADHHHGEQGALVPQDQTLKNTRSGTKKMLQAGLGKVRT